MFKEKTEIPIVDHPEHYGYLKKKVMMSPMAFFKLARLTSGNHESRTLPLQKYIQATTFELSSERAKTGLKSPNSVVPMGYFEFKFGRIKDHEGRNRALAAHKLEYEEIPVWFLWHKDDKEPTLDIDKIRSYWEDVTHK
jgi:hypothetical protein